MAVKAVVVRKSVIRKGVPVRVRAGPVVFVGELFMKQKFKVGDMVRITTDEASAAVMPGTVLQVGLIETIDGEPIYYLHGGDDCGFREQDIELVK